MNKKIWKKWAAALACCAVAWGSSPIAASAEESTVQNEEGILDRAGKTAMKTWETVSDYTEWFYTILKMKAQLLGTPLMEPYLVYITSGASRSDAENEAAFLPQPTPGSTLLSDHKTRFAWGKNKKAKLFTIKEADSGKIIYRENVVNQRGISLVPREVGMQRGRTYLWELDEDSHALRREMRLLDATLEKDIQKRLPELNAVETYEDVDRQMLQAAYLVALSDKSGGKADLHWLALELMLRPEAKSLKNETSAKVRELLLKACSEHLDKRLP